jgi:hypothetical protein
MHYGDTRRVEILDVVDEQYVWAGSATPPEALSGGGDLKRRVGAIFGVEEAGQRTKWDDGHSGIGSDRRNNDS